MQAEAIEWGMYIASLSLFLSLPLHKLSLIIIQSTSIDIHSYRGNGWQEKD